MVLPNFKYHPEPLKTEAIKISSQICECCNKARGYIYASSIYTREEVDSVCPWCIADGSVARKYDAELVDCYSLLEKGLKTEIIDEVCSRTPGYISWQSEVWLTCCNDACEFHGDAPQTEIIELDLDRLQQLARNSGFSIGDLQIMIRDYQPKGSPAFYKFICRHCQKVQYHIDCD